MNSYSKLGKDGALFIPSVTACPHNMADWKLFKSNWCHLSADRYYPNLNGQHRFRRYGRFLATLLENRTFELAELPNVPFRQSADNVPLYEGAQRYFAPLTKAARTSSFLHSLIKFDLAVIRAVDFQHHSYIIGVHMVRVVADPSNEGEPTPEGRHCDGHDYVAMHLIDRQACTGGSSSVYEKNNRETLLAVTMTRPLDTLIVNDSRMQHEVSPIQAERYRGFRDTLLIDINFKSCGELSLSMVSREIEMNVMLRNFSSRDYNDLITWFKTPEELYRFAGPTAEWPLTQSQLAARQTDHTVQAWTAYVPDNEKTVGHIEVRMTGTRTARLERVAVAPAERGKHLALPLVKAAIDQATSSGTNYIDLLVDEKNTPAIRTYRRAGFNDCQEPQRDRPFMRRMALNLQKENIMP